MALTDEEYVEIRRALDSSQRPLYFFHDDPDGLCSFLLLYRHRKEGKGVIVKTSPNIDSKFYKAVEGFGPDTIFILDIAGVEQDFIDEFRIPMHWIDHHGPYERKGIRYYNPKKSNPSDNQPASYLCYNVVRKDLWIAMAGIIGDMYWPEDLVGPFRSEHPGLLPETVNTPREAMFSTKIGRLGRIFSFALKGDSRDALRYVKVLTRIKNPLEILEESTAQGRFVYKKYEKVCGEYDVLLKEAKSRADSSAVLLYTYPESRTSFTGDLANELAYLYPDKVIIIGREKSGEVKCSLRTERHNIPATLEKALKGLDGYGGGHEHAAGCVVKESDFAEFIERLKKVLM